MRQTLKAQILTLWCRGRSYDEIVEALGCKREYIRATLSRARHGGQTPGDIASNKRQTARRGELYRTDPEYRAYVDAKAAAWRDANREHYLAWRREYTRAWRAKRKAQHDGAPLRGGAGRL
jgi:hypothetical protein